MKKKLNETDDAGKSQKRTTIRTIVPSGVTKVTLPDLQTIAGLVVRVLIGEPSFKNSVDGWPIQKECMTALAALLHNRIYAIPPKYQQKWIAGVTTNDYREILAAPGQFDGFGKHGSGNYTLTSAYAAIVDGRVVAANTGSPGPLTDAINHALKLAKQLEDGTFDPALDPFIGVVQVGQDKTTGRGYFMRTKGSGSPSPDTRAIPVKDGGNLAGNTFYTLAAKI